MGDAPKGADGQAGGIAWDAAAAPVPPEEEDEPRLTAAEWAQAMAGASRLVWADGPPRVPVAMVPALVHHVGPVCLVMAWPHTALGQADGDAVDERVLASREGYDRAGCLAAAGHKTHRT